MEAYPLHWPDLHPRTQNKMSSQFKTSLAGALTNVTKSIAAFGKDSGKVCTEIIVSSNVTLGAQNPKESGVAIWFKWDGLQLCIAVDRYLRVEENLQAIHHIIEARRTELRHGGLQVVRQTFMGFKALPQNATTKIKAAWYDILKVKENSSEDDVKTSYRTLSKEHHPDKPGGNQEKFTEICAAWEEAKKIKNWK